MNGVAEDSNKDVLGSDVDIEACADHEAGHADAIGNLLDGFAGATE